MAIFMATKADNATHNQNPRLEAILLVFISFITTTAPRLGLSLTHFTGILVNLLSMEGI